MMGEVIGNGIIEGGAGVPQTVLVTGTINPDFTGTYHLTATGDEPIVWVWFRGDGPVVVAIDSDYPNGLYQFSLWDSYPSLSLDWQQAVPQSGLVFPASMAAHHDTTGTAVASLP